MARFDSVLSFSSHDLDAAAQPTTDQEAGSDDDDAGFEFAFAPPLAAAGRDAEDALLAPADDLFAHGRILPAYPVLERGGSDGLEAVPPQASTAPPSPDTYCAWAPRSAPGSPARDFPKSASTGEARRFWRLRDLVGGRSHSDGKEKFVFLQPSTSAAQPKASKMAEGRQQANKPSAPLQQQQQKRQSKKKGNKAGAVTEMDMATAHKLFYGKQGAGALPGAGGERKQQSYLPYRTGIVGFFAPAHALGRSHHPY